LTVVNLLLIDDVLHYLRTRGYPWETWTTRELRKQAGIKYQLIYRLEKKRVIPAARRAANGRLFYAPREVYEMLSTIKNICLHRENKNG